MEKKLIVSGKRLDGRDLDQFRQIEAKVGILKRAGGSALFGFGHTIAIAAVFGPRILHPQHMQDPQKGLLRVNYNMMSFSVNDRIRPGPSKRSQEISKVQIRFYLNTINSPLLGLFFVFVGTFK